LTRTRPFNATGTQVSEVGLGTWQLGGTDWGDVSDEVAQATLHAAADAGTTFFDTADVYGMGVSESRIGAFLRERSDRGRFFVATKLGRRPEPGWPGNFGREVVIRHTEDSLRRLGVDCINLTQLHCIPLEALRKGAVFDHLRELKKAGKIRHFGASVESMEEALVCLEQEGLSSLQIIFNIFRQKPIDALFEKAKRKQVALIVRLPLASGLLAGKFTAQTEFPEKDHRNYNRDGQAFNVGETFAGLGLAKGAELADRLKAVVPHEMTMAQFALRWCLDFDAVTTIIPGARDAEQARVNAAASALSPLSAALHRRLAEFYEKEVAAYVRGPY
jgi:aryl-alcohol dehydrogenase-like predicted oxidoreductase